MSCKNHLRPPALLVRCSHGMRAHRHSSSARPQSWKSGLETRFAAVAIKSRQVSPQIEEEEEMGICADTENVDAAVRSGCAGRTLGKKRLICHEVIQSGTLTSTKGTFVKNFEEAFARMVGVRFAFACASGSAAVHTAVSALDPDPGDEIVTTAVTDMGALAPILYQGAIPVFADVDPRTLNVTARSIESCLSTRTRAIIVTISSAALRDDEIMALAVSEHSGEKIALRLFSRYDDERGSIGSSLLRLHQANTHDGGAARHDRTNGARAPYVRFIQSLFYGIRTPITISCAQRRSWIAGAVALAQLQNFPGVSESNSAAVN